MSLTSCLKKADDYLDPRDKSQILLRARELRGEGRVPDDAGRAAIDEQSAAVQALLKEAEADLQRLSDEEAKAEEQLASRTAEAARAGVAKSPQRQIDTPEFKAWFGDSKVVDAKGRPALMYHGSGSDISAFDPPYGGPSWFTKNPDYASGYAEINPDGQVVYQVHLKIENPLDLSKFNINVDLDVEKLAAASGLSYKKLARIAEGFFGDFDATPMAYDLVNSEEFADLARRAGFDGIMAKEGRAGVTWGVFDPSQVKSAIGNNGAFDAGNADITKSPQRHPKALPFAERTPEGIRAGADAIAKLPVDLRDDMTVGDLGGGDAYNLYEARKLLPKPSDKLKRVTDRSSFSLWEDYDWIANVDGSYFGINRREDPDADEDADPDDKSTPYVLAFTPLESPLGNETSISSSDVGELMDAIRASLFGVQKSPARVWYSQLQKAFESVPDRLSTMSAPQWMQWLKGNAAKLGVKQDEITWSGIEDYLKLRGKDKVTRDELAQWVGANGVQVAETTLSENDKPGDPFETVGQASAYLRTTLDDVDLDGRPDQDIIDQANRLFLDRGEDLDDDGEGPRGNTKYSTYQLPGGANYREVLLTLPGKITDAVARIAREVEPTVRALPEEVVHAALPAMAKTLAERYDMDAKEVETGLKQARIGKLDHGSFKSNHWDQRNVLAHISLNDRTDADGKRVLFVEEIQSDFGQDTKKQRAAIGKAVDADFMGIVERMKKAGVLTVECD